jgi:hypothetical protein
MEVFFLTEFKGKNIKITKYPYRNELVPILI